MKYFRILELLLIACLLVLPGWLGYATALAYDSSVSSSLRRSKDALLAQRSELLDACDKRKSQLNQLQQEIDRLERYIRDTDRTLQDIDVALSRS